MSTAPIPNFGLATFYPASGPFSFPVLLSDGHGVTSRLGALAIGAANKVTRGQIVHIDMATGAINVAPTDVLGDAATANAVVAENADPTAGAVSCLVYTTGKMKADAIVWPAAGSHAKLTDCLRDFGIYIESVLGTAGTFVKSVPTEEETAAAIAQLAAAKAAAIAAAGAAQGTPPDLVGGVADSPWAYMTEAERTQSPQLGDAPPEPPPGAAPAGGTTPGALAVSTASLPAGTAGTAYSATLAASGGTAPYTWTLASGTLNDGLTLAADGTISGTPTQAGKGTDAFTVKATDAASATATKDLSITVS